MLPTTPKSAAKPKAATPKSTKATKAATPKTFTDENKYVLSCVVTRLFKRNTPGNGSILSVYILRERCRRDRFGRIGSGKHVGACMRSNWLKAKAKAKAPEPEPEPGCVALPAIRLSCATAAPSTEEESDEDDDDEELDDDNFLGGDSDDEKANLFGSDDEEDEEDDGEEEDDDEDDDEDEEEEEEEEELLDIEKKSRKLDKKRCAAL
eukprot:9012981-Pyramimonas_sp.AAC.2